MTKLYAKALLPWSHAKWKFKQQYIPVFTENATYEPNEYYVMINVKWISWLKRYPIQFLMKSLSADDVDPKYCTFEANFF